MNAREGAKRRDKNENKTGGGGKAPSNAVILPPCSPGRVIALEFSETTEDAAIRTTNGVWYLQDEYHGGSGTAQKMPRQHYTRYVVPQ